MNQRLNVAAEPHYFAGASVRSQALGFGLRHTVRPITHVWSALPFDYYPPNLVDLAARALPADPGSKWRAVDLGNFLAEMVQARDVEDLDEGNRRVTLYFHGGAFLAFGLHTHRRLVTRISGATGQPVFNVAYRQMPDAPISTSIDDGFAAFGWLREQGYRTEDITVAGDSAGGFVAFSVVRRVIDAGLGTPAGIVMLSPYLELDAHNKSAHPNRQACDTFTASAMARMAKVAERTEHRHRAPRSTSPVDMPLGGLPPVLIQASSREILLADAKLMANRLRTAGVPCDLQIWDRQVHVFQAAVSWLPEAQAAIGEIGGFIRSLPEQRQPAKRPTRRTARQAARSARPRRPAATQTHRATS